MRVAENLTSRPLCNRRAMVVVRIRAQGRGLSFAPTFRHGFGKIGKEDREPEPDCKLKQRNRAGLVQR